MEKIPVTTSGASSASSFFIAYTLPPTLRSGRVGGYCWPCWGGRMRFGWYPCVPSLPWLGGGGPPQLSALSCLVIGGWRGQSLTWCCGLPHLKHPPLFWGALQLRVWCPGFLHARHITSCWHPLLSCLVCPPIMASCAKVANLMVLWPHLSLVLLSQKSCMVLLIILIILYILLRPTYFIYNIFQVRH